jgi:hypothetical protein
LTENAFIYFAASMLEHVCSLQQRGEYELDAEKTSQADGQDGATGCGL